MIRLSFGTSGVLQSTGSKPSPPTRYNMLHTVANSSEHEPVPSSRETTALAISSINRLDYSENPYIDSIINGVVHALSVEATGGGVSCYLGEEKPLTWLVWPGLAPASRQA
jgi:hypothetical protein